MKGLKELKMYEREVVYSRQVKTLTSWRIFIWKISKSFAAALFRGFVNSKRWGTHRAIFASKSQG